MREVSRAGLRRVTWALVGVALGIVVTLLLARLWPEERPGPDPIPEAPPTLGVGSPMHLVGPAHERFTAMTEPPRPLNTAEVRQALIEHYPRSLRDAGIGAAPTVWVRIDEGGRVTEAEVSQSSGFAAFDRAALEAVRRAVFRPARNGDEPVAVWVEYEIPFER